MNIIIRILAVFTLMSLAGCGILEEDISDRQIGIIAPADGAQVDTGAVRFAWYGIDYVAGYELTVVSPSFDRAERIAADTVIIIDTLLRNIVCTVPLGEGDYEWSVTPFNSAYTGEPRIATLHVIPVRE